MAMTKQFTKTQWNNDREPAITAEQLNRMEKGIDDNDTRIVELDKAVTANKNASDNSLAEVNKTLQKHTEDITAVNTELTSQGKAIGELADKKITKFYASSQGENTLNDSDNGKMQDMMLYGKSEQKQYSGKNLLNLRSGKSGTGGGVTFTRNADGSYTMKGTATESTGNVWFLGGYHQQITDANTLFVLEPGKYRTKDCVLFSGTNQINTVATIKTSTRITGVRNNYMSPGTTYDGTIYPMILDVNTDTGWEPYVGGIPSPNPDYPQEIKSVVEPVVKVTGKNLLKPILQTTTQYGVTCTNNGDGTYTLNGTNGHATDTARFNLKTNIPVDGKTYRIVGCPKSMSLNTAYLDFTNNVDHAKKDIGNGTTISLTGEYVYRVVIGVTSGYTCNNLVFKPMFVDNDKYPSVTYDDFEPYTEQSVPLTGITLNAIPVSSGGNVTIDGQQYISDYVDVERGKIVRMCKKIDFTTTDVYNYTNVLSNSREARYKYTSLGVKSLKDDIDVGYWCYLSSIRRYNKKTSTWGVDIAGIYQFGQGIDKDVLAIRVPVDRPASAYFKEIGGCIGLFVADTPTEESLSDELTEKLKALQTYYSQTNLFITSNQLDGYAIFNYPISLANGWNYVKQQIGDTRDYIYDMDLQMAQAYVNSEYAVALTELEV